MRWHQLLQVTLMWRGKELTPNLHPYVLSEQQCQPASWCKLIPDSVPMLTSYVTKMCLFLPTETSTPEDPSFGFDAAPSLCPHPGRPYP